jgi:hypothetical protein
LRDLQPSGTVLSSSLISYTFFPLATILRRNASSSIPDQVLEKILVVLAILCESWWWDCDTLAWEQIFMLCGAIVGGIESRGKEKNRDDETKAAAVQCLRSLLRGNMSDEELSAPQAPPSRATKRLAELQAQVSAEKFIPILGQTVDSLLGTSIAQHLPLQRLSLQVLRDLICYYAPEYFVPSIMPGVISHMTKVALGIPGNKGWAKGDIVAAALDVMQEVIIKSINDVICSREGAIRQFRTLEDFMDMDIDTRQGPEAQLPFATARTPIWLQATSSQLHMAINTLAPLVSHPTPSALIALSRFSCAVLAATTFTLPQSQPLLLSFLLSLSISQFPSVSGSAHGNLLKLLLSPNSGHALLQTLMQTTRDNLTALPYLLPSQADSKIEHVAGLVEAVCRLANATEKDGIAVRSIAAGVGKLLGPTGGVEKWGWSLLSALHLANPARTLSKGSSAQLMLEDDPSIINWVPFPDVSFKNVSSHTARTALTRMLRELGRAGGEACLFSVEWFTNIGKRGKGAVSTAALWCGCRLLEGVGGLSLESLDSTDQFHAQRSKRIEKLARGIALSLSELWDGPENDEDRPPQDDPVPEGHNEDGHLPVEHVKASDFIKATVDLHRPQARRGTIPSQHSLHKSLCLQLLSITAGILQARFTSLLLHTLYPVLHSLVSPDSHVSLTALATLNFITSSTSYASPANLLLSNFDYALDAVSRRLTRRWLDVDAAKVLAVLVRLVGSDIVQRAGDVVEECFDRLDDYHGYEVIVEGLVEVLGEVVQVVEADEDAHLPQASVFTTSKEAQPTPGGVDALLAWLPQRHASSTEAEDRTDYGPAPHEAWGKSKDTEVDGGEQDTHGPHERGPDTDPEPTAMQALTKQIVTRSMFFLSHGSSVIRARILKLLTSSVPVLPDSALLPSIHQAWPFILNRLHDSEPFVVGAAASLVESLALHYGSFMTRRIWDDIWPIFRTMLTKLDAADQVNALARRGPARVGTESAYTYSHRLYRSLLKTMYAAAKAVQPRDTSVWQAIIAFRRFLHREAHEELQACARDVYVAIGMNNEDAVWLALSSTIQAQDPAMAFLTEVKWDIGDNVAIISEKLAGMAEQC